MEFTTFFQCVNFVQKVDSWRYISKKLSGVQIFSNSSRQSKNSHCRKLPWFIFSRRFNWPFRNRWILAIKINKSSSDSWHGSSWKKAINFTRRQIVIFTHNCCFFTDTIEWTAKCPKSGCHMDQKFLHSLSFQVSKQLFFNIVNINCDFFKVWAELLLATCCYAWWVWELFSHICFSKKTKIKTKYKKSRTDNLTFNRSSLKSSWWKWNEI